MRNGLENTNTVDTTVAFNKGGAHASQGKRREHKSLPTEYKRGITEN